MKMKRVLFLVKFIGTLALILLLNSAVVVQAESARSVETGGSIGFSGTYIPEIEPQPEPPSGLEPVNPGKVNPKPERGRLPQMGQLLKQRWFWIGVLLVLLILIERKMYNRRQRMLTMYQN